MTIRNDEKVIVVGLAVKLAVRGPETVLNSERIIIDIFELWCWRRLLRIPWTARRTNKSVIE